MCREIAFRISRGLNFMSHKHKYTNQNNKETQTRKDMLKSRKTNSQEERKLAPA
jgi:hypothetical protein